MSKRDRIKDLEGKLLQAKEALEAMLRGTLTMVGEDAGSMAVTVSSPSADAIQKAVVALANIAEDAQ